MRDSFIGGKDGKVILIDGIDGKVVLIDGKFEINSSLLLNRIFYSGNELDEEDTVVFKTK
ncbi:hypothetical protein Glove_140g36 [Diversispora epigaea]|uniref:Uncharacterized protein n=1 Tax=Diversispora epigaea TaxID=1348612 RepID=A0A397J4D4_9GLOM|nr:hypothetical protein Glove_140g36 [Diversispora epigaea]